MTNSSNFLVTILNLKILFNFSVKVLHFTQNKQKYGIQFKIHFAGRTNNECFKFHFFVKFHQHFRNH